MTCENIYYTNQKLFTRGKQKYKFWEIHWLSKKIKIIFVGTTSQKFDGLKYEICCDACCQK